MIILENHKINFNIEKLSRENILESLNNLFPTIRIDQKRRNCYEHRSWLKIFAVPIILILSPFSKGDTYFTGNKLRTRVFRK